MNSEEVIKQLKFEKEKKFGDDNAYWDRREAFNIAIRHIQAWDKVKEEINQSKEGFKGKFTTESLKQIECLQTRNEIRQQCLDIIDKRLQEVTNCE